MFGKILVFSSVFILSACVGGLTNLQSSSNKNIVTKKIDSESLLDADGHWNIVEKSKSYDPAAAHLRARENVNIKRRGKKAALSAHFKPDAKSGLDGKLRVLRLEPQKGVSGNVSAYELADKKLPKEIRNDFIITPPAMPKRKILNRKTANTSPPISDVIIPKRKPVASSFVSDTLMLKSIPKRKPSFVSNLRAGTYSGSVRVVIEVSHSTKYKVAIDQLRNVLRVKMKDTNWRIAQKGGLKGVSLLGTYVAHNQNDGSALFEIRLKKKVKIVNSMVLQPHKGLGYRIVIDLQAV